MWAEIYTGEITWAFTPPFPCLDIVAFILEHVSRGFDVRIVTKYNDLIVFSF